MPNHLYYTTQRTLIEDLIARGAVITCAVDELAPRTPIAGWVCGEVKEEKSVFHYAFVRHNYLGKGLEQALIDSLPGYKPGFMTHRLPLKELTSWTHLPELCRRKEL